MPNSQVEILLVEDNPNDAELTVRALRKSGIANQITVARDGAEALDFLFCRGDHDSRDPANRPALILLDLKLPKVDGVEVLRAIKLDEQLKTIPIVVLTSSKETRDLQECYRLGVNSYVVKPVEFDQFSETVKQLGLYWMVLNSGPVG
jgi:two-component system response regulator